MGEMVRVSLILRVTSESAPEEDEGMCDTVVWRWARRKEEPGDFYRCPSVLGTTVLICQALQQLWTSFPTLLFIPRVSTQWNTHVLPGCQNECEGQRSVVTTMNLLSEHSCSLSFKWILGRSCSLKSRKEVKQVLCGSAGSHVYPPPLLQSPQLLSLES